MINYQIILIRHLPGRKNMLKEIEINSILKDFYDISGIRISIHDSEFNEIYSYPKDTTPFCHKLQQNPEIYKDCLKNDADAFSKVKKEGEVYVYKCRRGLYEAVAPIYHYGTISGYLMMGQICDNAPETREQIISKTEKILGNRADAETLTNTIKSIDRNLIHSYINIMTVLSEYLTDTNKLFSPEKNLPQLIAEYINKNYSSKITLSILSQKFECCNATLTNSFKNEYNISIMTYICNLRLKKAKEMLEKSRKSVKEISNDCGFYDQNYFSKTFSKKYGCSPTDYRKTFSLKP